MTRIPLLLIAVSFVLPACAVNEVITAEETELIVAETPPDESLLLDIGVVEFDGSIATDNDPLKSGIHEEIRSAEVRYLPYHLKTTLQGTGHWGAVRVIPSRDAFTDIIISGDIAKSDGEFITLKISVDDARSENRDKRVDPYQKVFNDIANDLKTFVGQLPTGTVHEIRQVTELKFFADMSPRAYGEHLTTNEAGQVAIAAVDRLRQIRERDRLVVDTLNEHYANFYYGIAIPYHSWRKTAREESINYRQVKRSAALQTLMGAVVLAGSLAVDTGSSSYSKSRMQKSLQYIAIEQGIDAIRTGFKSNAEKSAVHRY